MSYRWLILYTVCFSVDSVCCNEQSFLTVRHFFFPLSHVLSGGFCVPLQLFLSVSRACVCLPLSSRPPPPLPLSPSFCDMHYKEAVVSDKLVVIAALLQSTTCSHLYK